MRDINPDGRRGSPWTGTKATSEGFGEKYNLTENHPFQGWF